MGVFRKLMSERLRKNKKKEEKGRKKEIYGADPGLNRSHKKRQNPDKFVFQAGEDRERMDSSYLLGEGGDKILE